MKMPATKRRPQPVNEYEELMQRLGFDDDDCMSLFGHAGRTARRYRYGEGVPPLATIKLLRLMLRGVLTKKQVAEA
jgi:hypothetical protein